MLLPTRALWRTSLLGVAAPSRSMLATLVTVVTPGAVAVVEYARLHSFHTFEANPHFSIQLEARRHGGDSGSRGRRGVSGLP